MIFVKNDFDRILLNFKFITYPIITGHNQSKFYANVLNIMFNPRFFFGAGLILRFLSKHFKYLPNSDTR